MTTKLIRVLAVSAMMAAVGAPAMAQPAPPAAAERAGPGSMNPAERAEHRAERLRDILQLRPNQEPALDDLMKALTPPEGARERMRAARQEMRDLPTPARLDKQREHMLRRQQEFDRRAMAIKKFYAQLTPAQQKAFDALGPMGHRMGGKMKMRHHDGGHGGHGGHGGWGGHEGRGDRD
jgi:protein CpxP